VMFRLLFLFLAVSLVGCEGRPDETPPLLGVVRPVGKAVAKGQEAVIEGYAFDDTAVVSVRAGETEVLPTEEQGKKLVHFRFKVRAPESGEVRVRLSAKDPKGQERVKEVRLLLDREPPRVRLERVELVEGRLRIVGVAIDDVEVDRVVVHYGKVYSRLNLPRGQEVRFYVEVPAERAVVIAVDAVGQRKEVPAVP